MLTSDLLGSFHQVKVKTWTIKLFSVICRSVHVYIFQTKE